MPTNILESIAERRARDRKNGADARAYLLLIPLIACLFSILLSFESRAFEAVFIELADE